ncbi:homeobox protein prospero-like [Artemia franciscana]|uniref:Homeobox protein prospero n=1 Tax=Artemia franciscana TaxID=6661 RepID=A0AA88HDU0_ARTSF|nr:hypothetical protein QYM36_014947 [Artemia franciscana]KAK2707089.1 hypothetical protein QYM36_014947 [Artemia franciscana]
MGYLAQQRRMVTEMYLHREQSEVGQSVIRRSADSPNESGHYLRDILSTKKESEDSASSSDEEQQQLVGLELTMRPAETTEEASSLVKSESAEDSAIEPENLEIKRPTSNTLHSLLGCKKRKLYQPQQHESSRIREEEEPEAKYQRQETIEALQQEYARIYSQALVGASEKEGESQLDLSLKDKLEKRPEKDRNTPNIPFSSGIPQFSNTISFDATRRLLLENDSNKKESRELLSDFESFADLLKNELQTSLTTVIDQFVQRYVQQKKMAQQKLREEIEAKSRGRVVDRGARQDGNISYLRAPLNLPFFPQHKLPLYPSLNPLSSLSSLSAMSTLAGLSTQHEQREQEQNEALSLVVNSKKRRNKVTDARILNGRGCETPNLLQNQNPSPYPQSLPTSRFSPTNSPKSDSPLSPPRYNSNHISSSMAGVNGIPQPNSALDSFSPYVAYYRRGFSPERNDVRTPPTSMMHPAFFAGHHGIPDIAALRHGDMDRNSESSGETYDSLHPSLSLLANTHAATLTPMHLRKAKLMFFWVRYPSSSVLKMYFPDIRFNKNNTAQLVKWFSNFREFYYIQMEKFARQLLSDGVQSVDDVRITIDSELFRILNLHYNRNNHIEVPPHFLYVVEQTLKEFFRAIQASKDLEPSWKKTIYKIIARLDDNVPEYFKSPNFLEHLE